MSHAIYLLKAFLLNKVCFPNLHNPFHQGKLSQTIALNSRMMLQVLWVQSWTQSWVRSNDRLSVTAWWIELIRSFSRNLSLSKTNLAQFQIRLNNEALLCFLMHMFVSMFLNHESGFYCQETCLPWDFSAAIKNPLSRSMKNYKSILAASIKGYGLSSLPETFINWFL